MEMPATEGQFVRLGAWVKFEDQIPPPSNQLGFKITGEVHNEWLADMEPNKWKYISVVAPVKNKDFGFCLYIFDSMEDNQVVKIALPEIEIFNEEPKPRNVKSKEHDKKIVEAKLPKTGVTDAEEIKAKATPKTKTAAEEEESEGEAAEDPAKKESPARTNKKKEKVPHKPHDLYFDYGDLDKLDPMSRYVNDEDI